MTEKPLKGVEFERELKQFTSALYPIFKAATITIDQWVIAWPAWKKR